jgi:predicted transcriptional regulator
MDTAPRPNDSAQAAHSETEAERQRRLVWEAEGIARARASTAAGYYATSAEVKTWIDSLGTDNPLPVPTRAIRDRADLTRHSGCLVS